MADASKKEPSDWATKETGKLNAAGVFHAKQTTQYVSEKVALALDAARAQGVEEGRAEGKDEREKLFHENTVLGNELFEAANEKNRLAEQVAALRDAKEGHGNG